jgi:hypothetical protein
MMNSTLETTEYALLESVIANYRADGFDVFLDPPETILPPIEKGYRPDAVAIRPDKKIAIEVVRPGEPTSDRVNHLRGRFSSDNNWELQILYVSPGTSVQQLKVAPLDVIERGSEAVMELRKAGHPAAALVMAWSVLEAVARALLPERLSRPQPPAKLIETLASEGYVTPSEADTLRTAAALRNEAAHGRPDAAIAPVQLDAIAAVLRTLVGLLPKDAA